MINTLFNNVIGEKDIRMEKSLENTYYFNNT